MIVVSAFEPPAIVAGLDVKSRFNSVFKPWIGLRLCEVRWAGPKPGTRLIKSLATS